MSETDANRAFPLFERFAQPLIEKRSKEAVDKLSLSIAASRIKKGELSLSQIKEQNLKFMNSENFSKKVLEEISKLSNSLKQV